MAVHQVPEARDPGATSLREEAASWLDEHGDALYRYARIRVRRRELAEDLVQDTFVAALQARGRYEGNSSVRTWLLSILKHKIADHYRRVAAAVPPAELAPIEGHDPIRGEFFGADGLWKSPPASWRTPDKALEEREFWEVLDGCLGRLPRALASVFFLRELEGLEMEELRRGLDLSEGNIRVRLHRARLLLRECLERRWFAVTLKPPGRPT
jgi:RNA polymerase sigma-70 factor (ECF subfamily)